MSAAFQLSTKDPNLRCCLNKDAGERALLLKGPNGGDWGILIGGWTGIKQGKRGIPGVPGDRGSKRRGKRGVKGSPGNPGYLYCRFYNLKNFDGSSEVIFSLNAARTGFQFFFPGRIVFVFFEFTENQDSIFSQVKHPTRLIIVR